MSRWTSLLLEGHPRGWMLDASRQASASPGRSAEAAALSVVDSGVSVPRSGGAVALAEAPRRSPGWAGSQPGPLRRNHGVPVPLETPLFVHEAAVQAARRRRRLYLLAGLSVALAAATGVAVQRLGGGV